MQDCGDIAIAVWLKNLATTQIRTCFPSCLLKKALKKAPLAHEPKY